MSNPLRVFIFVLLLIGLLGLVVEFPDVKFMYKPRIGLLFFFAIAVMNFQRKGDRLGNVTVPCPYRTVSILLAILGMAIIILRLWYLPYHGH